MPKQGLLDASGVVLARSRLGEGGLWLTLFLKGQGLLRASAPGAEAGRVRFGGGTEPLVWGKFHLYQRRGLCLNGVDIADDMLALRGRPKALLAAVRWSRLLTRWLPAGQPDDALLANLYWNMRLAQAVALPEAAEWRFLWRWLTLWGLAPDLARCGRCGRNLTGEGLKGAWNGEGLVCLSCEPRAEGKFPVFTAGDLSLLNGVASADVAGLERSFSQRAELLTPRRDVLALASRCAEGLLKNSL